MHMSITNRIEAITKSRGLGMLGEASVGGAAAGALLGLLVERIERLGVEERDAVRRGDWDSARRAAVEKAELKEARQRTEVGERGRV